MSDAERRHGTSLRVLRHRDFAILTGGALVSFVCMWFQMLAVPFVIFRMTHSTTWLGAAAAAVFIPNLISSLVGGTFADRHSRRRILLVTQTLLMSGAFSFFIVWTSGWATPGLIVSIVFVLGFVQGFDNAAWQALIPQMVDRAELVDAVRVDSMIFTGSRAVGPALAGLVLQLAGVSTAFLLNGVSYLFVIGALVVIHPRAQEYATGSEHVVEQLRDGLRVARRDTTLMLSIGAAGVVSFFGISILQLAPAIAKEFFHVGKGAYGLLVAAFGAGALVGSILTVVIADRMTRSTIAALASIGLAASIVGLSLAPAYALGMVALFGVGVMFQLTTVPLNTAVQARVQDAYRGRVMSVYFAAVLLGVALGAFVAGAAATVIPLRAVIFGYGIALLLLVALAMVRYDRLRPFDESLPEPTPVATDAPDPHLPSARARR